MLRRDVLCGVLSMTLASGSAIAQPAADLIAAAAAGDLATVNRLLSAGADVRARDASGRTALLAATQGNHIEIARALIAAGSDVNAKDSIQDSPYLLAGARGLDEILRMTLAAGADLKSVNRYGGTALIPAAKSSAPIAWSASAVTTESIACSASSAEVAGPDAGSTPPRYLCTMAVAREARLPSPLASSEV